MKNKMIVGIIVICICLNLGQVNRLHENVSNEIIELKSSSIDITIISPENRNYSKPTYGYYPGSNSFDNDEIGAEPEWFEDIKTDGGTVQVLDSLDEHNTVVEMADSSLDNNTYVSKDLFAIPVNGTIEYWMRTDDASKKSAFHLYGGIISAMLIGVRISDNKFQRYNGSSWFNISNAESNKWHHVRIDFECTDGYYSNLTKNRWRIFIDGGLSRVTYEFSNNRSFAHTARWNTDWAAGDYNYKYYVDAIGFSWNQFYGSQQNMNEGYYLEFQAPSNLTWMAYSLNGNDNRTILGNISIPNPGNGYHSIQVFGNDSLDNTYQSEIIPFGIDNPTFIYLPGMAQEWLAIAALKNILSLKQYYGATNMRAFGYYFATSLFQPEFVGINDESSIFEMAKAIKNYLIRLYHEGKIKNRIDIMAFSQGSVVGRTLIKEHYYDLKNAGIQIIHFASCGGPNHGTWGFNKFYWNFVELGLLDPNSPAAQMASVSDFMKYLNAEDETPFDIYYTTYRGRAEIDKHYLEILERVVNGTGSHYNVTLINQVANEIGVFSDGAVACGSVPLEDALHNRFYENVIHGGVAGSSGNIKDIIWDLKSYPKLEFSLETPQNQTYYAPFKGYYLSTSKFENNLNNYKPTWFELVRSDGGTVSIVDEIDNHKKVLDIFDNSEDSLEVEARKVLIENQTYGTVEYWMRTDDAYKICGFRMDDGAISKDMVTLRTYHNFIQWWNGTDWTNIHFIESNTWYHIRVDFECTGGSYMGLAPHTWRLFLNGTEYGSFPFANNRDSLNRIVYYNDFMNSMKNYHYYIDAVGLSWDSDYTIGDNLNEGLFISMQKNFPDDWIKYSIDGMLSVPIQGDTTIPMPDDGSHSLYLLAQDSTGEQIQTDTLYFSVDLTIPDISINSPLNNALYSKESPVFNLNILEVNIEEQWYSLDGGTTTIDFSGDTVVIDQTEWAKYGNGTVSIMFNISDTGGRFNSVEWTVRKDIIAPSITLINPTEGSEFSTPPLFDCTATDPNGVAHMWYTLDGGITNTTFSSGTGQIDTDLWNASSDGGIKIQFYAEDSVGNIGSVEVNIIKDMEDPPDRRIPGYDVFTICAILSICILVSILQKKPAQDKI